MQIKTWPSGVPDCIMPLSPQGGPRDNRITFATDDGNEISRPRGSWAPDAYAVDLAPMSKTQFALFETWFKTVLAFGVHAFTMAHPVTGAASAWRIAGGDQPYQVRKDRLLPDNTTRGITVSLQLVQVYYDEAAP